MKKFALEFNSEDVNSNSGNEIEEHYSYKSTLAQCYAAFVNSLSFITVGMLLSAPTTVNGFLIGSKESLSLTKTEAAWYATLLLLTQPIGCISGGLLQGFIGRKPGILLMNILAVVSWLFLAKATSVEMLNTSSILMGIAIGFVEAPGFSYISEVTEPKIRGTLASYTNFTFSLGVMFMFCLTSVTDWRTSAIISIILPIISFLLFCMLPESPIWLLNKGRKEEALKSLRWFRGWVPTEEISNEFEKLSTHIQSTYWKESKIIAPNSNDKSQEVSKSPVMKTYFPSLKFKYFLQASTFRPFLLLICFRMFALCAEAAGAKPFIIEILGKIDLPWYPKTTAFLGTVFGVFGNLISVAVVRMTGKRCLCLISAAFSSLFSLAIGLGIMHNNILNHFTFILIFFGWNFAMFLGIHTMPWVFLGEIFPTKTRCIATGITGAMYYWIMSFFTFTFPDLRSYIDVSGCFILYSCVGFLGVVYLWFFLPETEGKSLVEIEEYFIGRRGKEEEP